MKKKNLKSLKLQKRTISNLKSNQVQGGGENSTIIVIWSAHSCPTIDCTEGAICSSLECLLDEGTSISGLSKC